MPPGWPCSHGGMRPANSTTARNAAQVRGWRRGQGHARSEKPRTSMTNKVVRGSKPGGQFVSPFAMNRANSLFLALVAPALRLAPLTRHTAARAMSSTQKHSEIWSALAHSRNQTPLLRVMNQHIFEALSKNECVPCFAVQPMRCMGFHLRLLCFLCLARPDTRMPGTVWRRRGFGGLRHAVPVARPPCSSLGVSIALQCTKTCPTRAARHPL